MHFSKSDRIRIAVTSVGSGIGQSIVDSCKLSSLPLDVTGLDMNPYSFGGCFCDHFGLIPAVSSDEYLEVLLTECKRRGIQLLIPGLDSELLILARSRERFEAIGTRVLVGGADFIELVRDKVEWSRRLSAKSEVILPCYDRDELGPALAAGKVKFPLIAKPKDGSASEGLVVLNSESELDALGDGMVIQPFILPTPDDPNYQALVSNLEQGRVVQLSEHSYQLVYSKSGELLGRVLTHNRLKAGVPIEVVPIDDSAAWEGLEPLLSDLLNLDMYGPVNIQGRLTVDGPRFFEMNARFTGITGLRGLCGFNEVEALIRDFLDLDPMVDRPLAFNPRRVGFRQVTDVAIDPEMRVEVRDKTRSISGAKTGLPKIVVTGASGWLGRRLVNDLLDGDPPLSG